MFFASLVILALSLAASSGAGFRADNISRPLRYSPDGTDFVITNGTEFFNRPLYGGSSAFRVDAGDAPEFSLYLPGQGGNLRLALRANGQVKWLHGAQHVVARYRPGMMLHEIRDPMLGNGTLRLAAVATRADEGLILRAELSGGADAELLFAFGGLDGLRGRRGGDIGCESEPVSKFFQLRPEQCDGNILTSGKNSFAIRGKPGLVGGIISADAWSAVADAEQWENGGALFASTSPAAQFPVITGGFKLAPGRAEFIGLQRLAGEGDADEMLAAFRDAAGQGGSGTNNTKLRPWRPSELPGLFAAQEAERRAVAERVTVETPDPFINASVAALNIAADAVWDDSKAAYLHGGVAWRIRLLGWRVAHAGDALGWHERTARHFEGYVKQQNTNPIPANMPVPEDAGNLARNETALHSNGDMTKSHYDMNLIGVDAFFRHLLWTGDKEFAQRMWPAIERHLAWERRLFRREFGADKLPLYEAYCCIWASDDLAYNGGGATHSSAFNLFHNRMAARVAVWLGKDPAPYEHEAKLIAKGMNQNLWLADRGWFAEWKDLIALQLVHPNAAAWTFYHTVDSGVPSAMEAWQMTQFVETQIARFPLTGPGVPPGNFNMPTTSWMPYTWSLNNVVLGETMHTALGNWQANRPAAAFPLFKGALIDSMFLGLCPGNVGMSSWFDATRRESQRDFGDGVGAMSRAVVEGLFGVQPDLIAGEITLRPGLPPEWNTARIRHPDFQFSFKREGLRETYDIETVHPLKLRLQAAALRDSLACITVDGRVADWRALEDSTGTPRIGIEAAAARRHTVVIEWRGKVPLTEKSLAAVERGGEVVADCGAGLAGFADPQGALSGVTAEGSVLRGRAIGTAGHRTVFARMKQGGLRWWLPVTFEILAGPGHASFEWSNPITSPLDVVDLAAIFNDRVTNIFQNEYLTPRSPFCSLATPKQGTGSWCHPKDSFDVDDSGLRAFAAKGTNKIILPNGIALATPGDAGAKNIAFVSQWDNFPREISVPLAGKSSRAFLLMAGSTTAMQSRFDNGEVIVTYTDGTTSRLALHNPTTWWPIDQDYYIDDFAFARPEPLPVRVDLATGKIRVLSMERFKGRGGKVPGGAATVLHMPLDANKELKSLTLRALANEVVIGLMSVTLQR